MLNKEKSDRLAEIEGYKKPENNINPIINRILKNYFGKEG